MRWNSRKNMVKLGVVQFVRWSHHHLHIYFHLVSSSCTSPLLLTCLWLLHDHLYHGIDYTNSSFRIPKPPSISLHQSLTDHPAVQTSPLGLY